MAVRQEHGWYCLGPDEEMAGAFDGRKDVARLAGHQENESSWVSQAERGLTLVWREGARSLRH